MLTRMLGFVVRHPLPQQTASVLGGALLLTSTTSAHHRTSSLHTRLPARSLPDHPRIGHAAGLPPAIPDMLSTLQVVVADDGRHHDVVGWGSPVHSLLEALDRTRLDHLDHRTDQEAARGAAGHSFPAAVQQIRAEPEMCRSHSPWCYVVGCTASGSAVGVAAAAVAADRNRAVGWKSRMRRLPAAHAVDSGYCTIHLEIHSRWTEDSADDSASAV